MKNNKRGFTLVELLLVIAIIGILAAVLFVSLGSQRQRARITGFKEQMRALVTPITTCLDDSGTLRAYATNGDVCSTGSNHGQFLRNDTTPTQMPDCDGTLSYTIALYDQNGDGVNDGYRGTCTTSGGNCQADCTVQGCTYSAGCN